MRSSGPRRRSNRSTKSFFMYPALALLALICTFTLLISLKPVDDDEVVDSSAFRSQLEQSEDWSSVSNTSKSLEESASPDEEEDDESQEETEDDSTSVSNQKDGDSGSLLRSPDRKMKSSCATVEEMGEAFRGDGVRKESLRVRKLIQRHFEVNGATHVRKLPPQKFCKHNFVLGKASEAGFGNEMYKILTAASLSIMLNRSLIIGQSRGKYPFGEYISYTNQTFTLKEVKRLWRRNNCVSKYGRDLVLRIDDFLKPSRSEVLCSNWRQWKQPIIWLQNTTDAVASQFFLKSIHQEMRDAAVELFGRPELLDSRPNVYGELLRVLVSPSASVEEAVQSVIRAGGIPDISLHMRMLMSRYGRAGQAALSCIRKTMRNLQLPSKPKVVLISDTPTFIKIMKSRMHGISEVLHFDYEDFRGNISTGLFSGSNILRFRVKDWGPAPRWVAFVDFFLAAHAKHAVVTGAHRRVGTTYAQLIAALAAARNLNENSPQDQEFLFLSSFPHGRLGEGLANQIGWGHVWNRFAGPLSCRGQSDQCAMTPLLPPAWWDGTWQSPIPRDVRRLEDYGVKLSGFGTVDERHLQSYCASRKTTVVKVPILKT